MAKRKNTDAFSRVSGNIERSGMRQFGEQYNKPSKKLESEIKERVL